MTAVDFEQVSGGGATRLPRGRGQGIDTSRLSLTSRRAMVGLTAWPRRGGDRFWGWAAPILLTLVSFAIRATGVTHPFRTYDMNHNFVGYFDETYYARDAHSLLLHGVELQGTASGQFVVHPPLGKWMIAAGEWVFGYNELGFRISSVVIGSLTILVFTRMVRRMTRSTTLGMLGGVLLSLDALEFVQSRISTLDIFLLFWIVCAFACLAADRDFVRARLLERLPAGVLSDEPGSGSAGAAGVPVAAGAAGAVRTRHAAGSVVGPRIGFRWWLAGTGICIGAACSVKWSGAPYVIVLALLAYAWTVGARRSSGISRPGRSSLRRDTLPLIGAFLILPAIVYTVSWSGWFATSGGYDREMAGRSGVVGTLENWVDYHKAALCFHEGLTDTPTKKDHLLCGVDESQCTKATPYDMPLNTYCYSSGFPNGSGHPYESKPFGWLALARPVAYAYDTVKSGQSLQGQKCTAKGQDCSRAILAVDTPVLWWPGLLCVLACFGFWAARRDWRATMVLVGFAAGFFPWFQNTQRVMFQFYALPLLPFVVLAVVLVAERALGGVTASPTRRAVSAGVIGAFTLAVLADFIWLHPVLAADVIPYSAWHARVVSVLGFPHWI